MSRDRVIDVPPPPVTNEMPLGREASNDLSTRKSNATSPAYETEQKKESIKSLPNFEIVPNLKELERIESRQNRLGALTDEILKCRNRAHKNEDLRKVGKIPDGAPSEAPPSTYKPDITRPNQPIELTNEGQLAEARERAQKEGKKLLVEVYGSSCHFCVRQERTMKDPEIQGLLQNAVVVKINGDLHPGLRDKLGVSGYPTTEIVSPGKAAARFPGEMSRRQLIDALR